MTGVEQPFPFNALPPELRENVFSQLFEAGGNRSSSRYAFSTGALQINKSLAAVARSVLDNECDMVAIQLDLVNIATWLPHFLVPFQTTDPAQVNAFVLSRRHRLHLRMGAPQQTANWAFEALLLARDLRYFCHVMQLYFYGRTTVTLASWNYATQPSGQVSVTRPANTPVAIAMTLVWNDALLRRLNATDERSFLAPFEKMTCPGMLVNIIGVRYAATSTAHLPTRIGPRVLTLSSVAWYMLAVVKEGYRQMKGLFRTGQVAQLEEVYYATLDAWESGFLEAGMAAHPHPHVEQHVALPIAASKCILLDCAAMLALLDLKLGRLQEASQLLNEAEAREDDLADMPREDTMGFHHVLVAAPESRHPEIYRCRMILDLAQGPHKPNHNEQELVQDVTCAGIGFWAMSALKPDRAHLEREAELLSFTANDDIWRDSWVNGDHSIQAVINEFQLGNAEDTPKTETAHDAGPPVTLAGWA